MTRHEFKNSKARHGVTVSVEEQWRVHFSSVYERLKFSHCLPPGRADANFSAFAMNLHRTGSGCVPSQIFNRDSNRLTGSSPRVIKKQQQGVIPLAEFTPPIRRLKG